MNGSNAYRTAPDEPSPKPWIFRLLKLVFRNADPNESAALIDLQNAVVHLAARLEGLEAYLCTLRHSSDGRFMCPELQIQRQKEAEGQKYGDL